MAKKPVRKVRKGKEKTPPLTPEQKQQRKDKAVITKEVMAAYKSLEQENFFSEMASKRALGVGGMSIYSKELVNKFKGTKQKKGNAKQKDKLTKLSVEEKK